MTQTETNAVTIDSKSLKWRFKCPSGHTSWSPTNHHFWCQSCARAHDPDATPEFYELRDMKTGRKLSRDDVNLRIPDRPAQVAGN